MKALKKIVEDKSTNHTLVAILIGFGTATFVMNVAQWWNEGPNDYWQGQLLRSAIAYIVILVLAEMIAGRAKS